MQQPYLQLNNGNSSKYFVLGAHCGLWFYMVMKDCYMALQFMAYHDIANHRVYAKSGAQG